MEHQLPVLKEIRLHGTKSFPCAIYRTYPAGKGTFVKHHWHDEVEILYFSAGKFQLEINMDSFPVTLFFPCPSLFSSQSARNITGISTAPPILHRTALKVNGPMYSIPTLCATKATPQIVAVSSKSNPFFHFIGLYLCLLSGQMRQLLLYLIHHLGVLFFLCLLLFKLCRRGLADKFFIA